MRGYTHLVFGIVVALLFLVFVPSAYVDRYGDSNENVSAFLFLFLVALGALLPDIDHPGSLLGKRVKLVGWLFSHRGIWHSLLLPAAILGLGWFFFPWFLYPSMALSLGIVSHLLLDGLTPRGVRLFYPFSDFQLRGFLKTGGALETVLFIGILITMGWLLWQLF
ncbi:metal-dependent hydrolase [Candidatus Woesearchaeota archaeon]|nr:metal-dependent hydrolase [Candidatus Woesearchaeota archaeon]